MGIVIYQNGKKAAEKASERLIIEHQSKIRKVRIRQLEDSLTMNGIELQYIRKEKQRIKIIYREIPNIINNMSADELDSSLVADGFHPVEMCPCK